MRERSVEPPKFTQRMVWPGLQELQRWKLPAGTIFVAADATVIYPDGTVETWAAIQGRTRKEVPPEPSEPETPLTEEVAVPPSPELLAVLQRQEWEAHVRRQRNEAA
jgi:hypothetical protein